LIAEDDSGHAQLIRKNIGRAGIGNRIIHFRDGQQLLEFLFRDKNVAHWSQDTSYLILLDIRMPRVDGIEVLEKIKADEQLKQIPVVVLTTTDDPIEIGRCYRLGCSTYIKKPLDYREFIEMIRELGLYLQVVSLSDPIRENDKNDGH